jgi:hypothetical protein
MRIVLINKYTSTNIESIKSQKVHPHSNEYSDDTIYKIKLYKHFLSMSSDELSDENITGFRNSFAITLQKQSIGYLTASISIMFLALLYTWLAIEAEIYGSSTATTVVHIFELVLMCYFLLETMIIIAAYGPKLYFSGWRNLIEIPVILTLVVILILDLIDDKYRVEGVYRCFRVKLAFLRITNAYKCFYARRIASQYTDYDARRATENVFDIISNVVKRATDPKLKSDLTYCLQMIYSGRIKSNKHGLGSGDPDKDYLSWARKNSEKYTDSNVLFEKREKIKKKVLYLDMNKMIELEYKVDLILSQVDNINFDIFELNRETDANEMLVCATYLFKKHNLYEK